MNLVIEYYLEDELKIINSKLDEKIVDEDENLSFLCEFDNSGLSLTIFPKRELAFKNIYINYDLKVKENEKIFFSGYQSSSYSYEDGVDTINKGLNTNFFIRNLQDKSFYGDYNFASYKNINGYNHGYSYMYIRDGEKYRLFASLNEKFAYTRFIYQKDSGLIFECDINSYKTANSFVAFNICFLSGKEDDVFDEYFKLLNLSKPNIDSFYAYKSNTKSICNDLFVLKNNKSIDTILIDADKDILNFDYTNIVEKIHNDGYKAGLCLTPFCVESDSFIFKNHKDWLLLDENNCPLRCLNEDKILYALDIYNEDFILYLKKLFSLIIDKWDFDLIVFDYLYSACVIPLANKPRASIMRDGLNLLKNLSNNKIIVTRDVPIASCFGVVDACFVSSRINFENDDVFYLKDLYLEESSYEKAMFNLISRRQLNKKAFCSVGEVFATCKNDYKEDEKKMMLLFNSLFASSSIFYGNVKNIPNDISFDKELIDICFNDDNIDITYKEKDSDVVSKVVFNKK